MKKESGMGKQTNGNLSELQQALNSCPGLDYEDE